jgi:hypothetical protein
MVYETVIPDFDLADESLEWRQLYRKKAWEDRVNDATWFVESAKRPVDDKKSGSKSEK